MPHPRKWVVRTSTEWRRAAAASRQWQPISSSRTALPSRRTNRKLYIADTGATHVANGPRHIRVFDVGADGITLGGGKVFASCSVGLFDGFRVDMHGNVWTSTGEGVLCYAPDGTLLGKILVPEVVANVEFGGPKRNRLFICGTTSLYAIYLNTKGAGRPG